MRSRLVRAIIQICTIGCVVKLCLTFDASEELRDSMFEAEFTAAGEVEMNAPLEMDTIQVDKLYVSCKQQAIMCTEYIAVLRRIGRAAEARMIAQDAIRRSPVAWPLWMSLGLLLASDGDFMAARWVSAAAPESSLVMYPNAGSCTSKGSRIRSDLNSLESIHTVPMSLESAILIPLLGARITISMQHNGR
jgi:hypothetical protein